jgi:tRNA threonylcarbamoyladenosine biosynthesis protein TsaB
MPSHLLCIETTTTQCSVALCADGELTSLAQSNHENYQHAQLLHTYIVKVLSKHNLKPSDLAAIALSSGPGSYTGLRIGAAAAKGLCYANDIPLIAIPTLDIVAREITPSDGHIIATLDARRDEVYCAIYTHDYHCVQPASPHIISPKSFAEWTAKGPVYFVGTGLEKCEEIVDNNTQFVFPKDPSHPSAAQMVKQAQDAFEQQVFEDVAYFDVDYLKAFQTSPQKKNALGQST